MKNKRVVAWTIVGITLVLFLAMARVAYVQGFHAGFQASQEQF